MELEGQVAFVTAAAGQGIGQEISRRFAAAGAHVVITDIHERRTAAVAAAIAEDHPDVRVLGVPMDGGDRDAIDDALARTERELGPVTLLVNNAAVNILGSIFDYDPDDWDRVVAVNLSGPWYLARCVMPGMRDAGGGTIINISTFAPDVGGEGIETPYATTKGGLNALTRCIAQEGGPHGIRSNAIAMGIIAGTRFADAHPDIVEDIRDRSPLRVIPTPADIAELALFLAGPRGKAITGEIYNVAAGSYMRT